MKLLLKPEEAAAAISVGRTTMFALLARGEVESVTIGRSRRVPAAALAAYVAALPRAPQCGLRPSRPGHTNGAPAGVADASTHIRN